MDAGPCRVYPRAGGGTGQCRLPRGSHRGLSPRRRGNHGKCSLMAEYLGSIPAQAGEPSPNGSGGTTSRVYPRAGGGTFPASPLVVSSRGLSPRRRGNPPDGLVGAKGLGSIPAQAGEPQQPEPCPVLREVYPRAGGGTPCYQIVELSAISKNVGRVEPRLFAFYEQNPVCVHDLFRGFTESLDAKIPDGLRIAPDEDDRPRTKRFPPS